MAAECGIVWPLAQRLFDLIALLECICTELLLVGIFNFPSSYCVGLFKESVSDMFACVIVKGLLFNVSGKIFPFQYLIVITNNISEHENTQLGP